MPLVKKDKVPKIILEEKKLEPTTGSLKHIATTMLLTLVFTMFLGAVFHLTVVGIFAIVRADFSLINPIEFLGLNTIAPELGDSSTALLIGWLVLVVLYWIVYRLLTGFDKIVAFWYTSDTYNILENRKDDLSVAVKKLREVIRDDYQVKQFESFYYLLKRSKKSKKK
jgi:hypothetical protein